MKNYIIYIFVLVFTFSFANTDDKGTIFQSLSNPFSNLWHIHIREELSNVKTDDGVFYKNVIKFQPKTSFTINDKYHFFTRINVGYFDTEGGFMGNPSKGLEKGFSDPVLETVVVRKFGKNTMFGFGLAAAVPIGNYSMMHVNKFQFGPTVGLTYSDKRVSFALIVKNLEYVQNNNFVQNYLEAQYFLNINLSNNWFISSSPTIKVDWTKEQNQRTTLPLALGINKIIYGKDSGMYKIGIELQKDVIYNKNIGSSNSVIIKFSKMFMPVPKHMNMNGSMDMSGMDMSKPM